MNLFFVALAAICIWWFWIRDCGFGVSGITNSACGSRVVAPDLAEGTAVMYGQTLPECIATAKNNNYKLINYPVNPSNPINANSTDCHMYLTDSYPRQTDANWNVFWV